MNATVRFARCSLIAALVCCTGVASLVAADGEINDRAVENLAHFARLYGYVRFFHPSDEAATINWDKFAILGAQRVRDAADNAALRQALVELFEPVAVDLRIGSSQGSTQPPVESLPPSSDRQTFWQHSGIQLSSQSNIYQSRRVIGGETMGERVPVFQPIKPPPRTLEKLLAPEIAVELPLVVTLSAEGKASAGKSAQLAALQQRLAAGDLAALGPTNWEFRVGGVIIAWNVFQHFHPYIDSIGLKWEEVLRPTLRRALADRNRDDYYATLSELVAHLQDGHGHVYGDRPRGGLPIRVAVIEDQLVVTGVAEDAPFRKGDVITRIDDVEAMELLRQRERYVSGSPQLRRFRALNQFGQGPEGSVARVEVLRDTAREQLEVTRLRDQRGFFFNSIPEFEFPPFSEVRPGIFYVNNPSIQTEVLEFRLPELASARGVIFDTRWDGRAGILDALAKRIQPHQHIIPHLIDKPIQASPMRVPKITQPDRAGWIWSEGAWPVQPKAPRLKGRVVFINEPSVVSYGETCMAMIADYGLATLVGGPTAGCNGNANYLLLPGGFRIMWTGMEVLKHDHSPFYLTGFVPDHPVARTIKAVKEGRDEYLEKAIAVIEQATEPKP